jgi:hypothetical protein
MSPLMRNSAPAVTCRMAWFRTRTWTRTWIVAACLVGVATLAASCGGSPSASGHHTDHPSTTTTHSQRTAALAAYRASQVAFDQAIRQADPTVPALAQTMTGAELDSVRRSLVSDQANGIVGRGTVQLHPKLVLISSHRAVIHDCTFSSLELVYKSTGKPVPPATPPQHDGVTATLIQTSAGTWKVSTEHVTEGSCPAGY